MIIRTASLARVTEPPPEPKPPALVVFGRSVAGKPRAAWFAAAEAESAATIAKTMQLHVLATATDEQRSLAGQLAAGRVLPNGLLFVPATRRDLYARIVALAGDSAGPGVAGKAATATVKPDLVDRAAGKSKPSVTAATASVSSGEDGGPASNAGAAAANQASGEPGGKALPAPEAAKPRPADRTFVGAPLPQDRGEIGLGSFVLAHESPDDGWWEAEVIGINGPIFSLRWRDYPTQPTILRKAGELALLPPSEA